MTQGDWLGNWSHGRVGRITDDIDRDHSRCGNCRDRPQKMMNSIQPRNRS